ncbi:MAG: ABC transporter ATP-binding protein [Clostridia bacterium]|nr:ABC transporter ATP-binding protein [Clostridia bacterium]
MESSNKRKESNSKTLKWIYGRTKKYFPMVILISVLSVISSLSYIWLALLSKDVLDIATGSMQSDLMLYACLIVGVVLLQIILQGADSVLKTYTLGKLTITLRTYLFGFLSRKKYSEATVYHSGDLLNRFTSDTDVVASSVINIIPNFCSMLSKIVGGITTLIVLNPKIAIIILATGLVVPAFGRILNRKFKLLHKAFQQTEGKTRSFAQECFENIVIVKIFESETPFIKKLNQFMNENFKLRMKRNTIWTITSLSLYSFFTLGYYAVLVWGAGRISTGAITYGTLMAFLQLVQQLRTPLQNFSGIVPQYYSALASAERIIDVASGEEDLPPLEKNKLELIKNDFTGIEVKNITFAYKDEIILKNCSFDIPKGKITALTGESGSGKSTIFKLLLGLYEPQSGEITVNGNIKLDTSLRGLFAYVPQGNLVLSGTIRENLTLCNDNIPEEKLINATKAAEIYDLIESLPEGFDSPLSERGAGLSEGQIQRISIARALLTNAPVLLLDEATSALDEETETNVLNNITAMSDKTVLFVTHRNTSLKACNRIVHVENKVFSVIKE